MEDTADRLRLLKRGKVSSIGELVVFGAVAAVADLLGEEAHVGWGRCWIFAAGDDAAGDADGARGGNGVRPAGEPLLDGDERRR